MDTRLRVSAMALGLSFALSACGTDDPQSDTAPPAPPSTTVAEMPEMGIMAPDTLDQNLSAHMQQMDAADGAVLQGLVPRQRELVIAMIEECKAMMRQMGMSEPGMWTRLENALREDVDRMAEMDPADLERFFPEHRDRVQRMLDMRRDMMAGM